VSKPRLAVVSVLLTIILVSAAVRYDDVRWLFGAADYQRRVLAQPISQHGDLQHVEWGGWGIAGQETTVFLVYDPADNLATAKRDQSGEYVGIPCEVPSVRALERNWYLVTFYTNADWTNCSP